MRGDEDVFFGDGDGEGECVFVGQVGNGDGKGYKCPSQWLAD